MKKTLTNYYLLVTLVFIAITAIANILIMKSSQDELYNANKNKYKEEILANYKNELKARVEIIEQYITNQNLLVEEQLKNDISKRVREAHDISMSLYNQYKDKKSTNEIKELIKTALRDVRFNNGRGYFFIDDIEGNCILYPIRPDLEGKNIINLQDINKKYVIKDFINIVQSNGAGFSEYLTYKYKYQENDKRYKKIAYVMLFEPFNWVLGTGEYTDDVVKDIQKEIAFNVNKMKVSNKTSYINIFEVHDFKGGDEFATMVVNPNRDDIYGKKISSTVKDIDGKMYRAKSLELINNYGEGFVTYKYKKLNSNKVEEKLTYVKLLNHWNWVVSTGIYLDELEYLAKEKQKNIKLLEQENSKKTLISLCILFSILIVLTFYIAKILKKNIDKAKIVFKKAVIKREIIDQKKLDIADFQDLASFANEMLENINIQQEALKKINSTLETTIEAKTEELIELNKFLEDKNKELEQNYYTDHLTGLKNRNMFAKNLATYKNPVAIILDIDGFKNINDFYGMISGDDLLIAIAKYINHFAIKNEMNAYRLSSDEFLLCFDKEIKEQELKEYVEKFLKLFAQEEFFDSTHQNRLNIEFTIGMALEQENILGKADIALNFAKKKKLSYVIYDSNNPHMNTYKHNIYWREKIQWAIKEDLVVPFFQPIVNIEDKSYKKFEALIRIKDGSEVITPYMFLDVAKETKLYPTLTKIMIAKTFEKFHNTNIEFSINLSLQDIEDENTVKFLQTKLDEYDVSSRLILEMLESEEIIQSEKFLPFVHAMRKRGVRFALDDFGSGYSNFSFLLKMHPKYLKIDGSLIKRITYDENSLNIVKTIMVFANQINATIIAEFVENEKIVEVLESLGIKHMQGYHFAPPSEEINI